MGNIMATIQFLNFTETFAGISPDNTGTLSTTKSVTFQTNVISATAAIQSFRASYGIGNNFYSISVVGASITNLQWSGTTVTFNVSVQIFDGGGSPHYAKPEDSEVIVTVIANCE